MESNNQYNPLDDTVNTVLTGLLPVLIVGLFKGFKKAKRRGFSSPINAFDDFIIFSSIIIYPLVSGLQRYSNYSNFGNLLIIISIAASIRILTLYFKAFINMQRDIEYYYKKSVIYFSIFLLCFISLNSYNHISQFCIDNFHLGNFRFLRTITSSIYGICGMLSLFVSIYYYYHVKFTAIHKWVKEIHERYPIIHYFLIFANHFMTFILMIYPPIIVGYLLSTNSITTKISFSICSISFSRLVAHFGEAPEDINTVISYYLNYHEGLKINATEVQRNEILNDILEILKKVEDLL
ncbi:2679_t:CDS:1 [Dentiscutata erythropus]|uniref:2679_t:CDS:1 n=1 Tax=Dentiscutata erythropus TaxID=1348616 RepID=A0A9N9JRS8_9GLOM|nr:2679_t:CDS:1 [Dentiscutata erythropus]